MLIPDLYTSHLAVQPQTGSASLRAWTTGQILEATVVRQALDGTVTLRIGNQEVQARTGLALGYPPDEPLLGIYWGVPLNERSVAEPPLYPDTIFIFKEPLEEMCETREELEQEIEITVVHEVAHFLGMTEERQAELGYE